MQCTVKFTRVSAAITVVFCACVFLTCTSKEAKRPIQGTLVKDPVATKTPNPQQSHVVLLDKLVELRTCPEMNDPTLQAALSEESILGLATMEPEAAMREMARRKDHLRPFLVRVGCLEPSVSANVYIFRSFLVALAHGHALLDGLVGDSTYLARRKGIEQARESLGLMLMGVVGSSLGLPQSETQKRALALLAEVESFRQMNHAGRAYWIAAVEQGFLQNNQVKEHHQVLLQSVELAEKVNLEPEQTGVALKIHKLSTGQEQGDGWYRAISTVGGFSVEMPILATEQTRGVEPRQAYELVGAAVQPSGDFQHATFTTRCMRPSVKKSEAQIRESFADMPGAAVTDANHEEHFGLSAIVPGKSGVRIIQFPKEACIVGVEFSDPKRYDEGTVKRFLGSFRTL